MPKQSYYQSERPAKPSKIPLNPIWRGIGCLMIVFIPAISYVIASYLVENREIFTWMIVPQDLINNKFKDTFLLVRILYTGILTLIIGAGLALFTYVINGIFGVSRVGPLDVPPEDVKK